jgi:hypothetical protein
MALERWVILYIVTKCNVCWQIIIILDLKQEETEFSLKSTVLNLKTGTMDDVQNVSNCISISFP